RGRRPRRGEPVAAPLRVGLPHDEGRALRGRRAPALPRSFRQRDRGAADLRETTPFDGARRDGGRHGLSGERAATTGGGGRARDRRTCCEQVPAAFGARGTERRGHCLRGGEAAAFRASFAEDDRGGLRLRKTTALGSTRS